jgi:hypothetical protein
LAWPPLTCNFTKPVTSFAILLHFGISVPIVVGTPKFNKKNFYLGLQK